MKANDDDLAFIYRMHKHGVTWILLFVIFFAAHPSMDILFRIVDSAAFVLQVILLTYISKKLLIESLLQQQRLFLFFFVSSLTVVLFGYGSMAFDGLLLKWMKITPVYDNLLVLAVRILWFILVVTVAVLFYIQRKEKENQMIRDELKSEKLDMELRYLKSQINPHFLFNALNNIYSMVYTHDDNAADSILKLSEMLRYVLVDCQASTIPLQKEFNYVENYIDFQMMSMEGERNVRIEKDIDNMNFMIAPMILQPIVENCFKYSRLDANPNGFIYFRIGQKDGTADFSAKNSIANNLATSSGQNKDHGIGLKNVQQRLQLHYGDNFRFDVKNADGIFMVNIHINNNGETSK